MKKAYCGFLAWFACVTMCMAQSQMNPVPGSTQMSDNGYSIGELMYPGEGWDIGAYQYFPGKYIGVPLLFYPSSTNTENIVYTNNAVGYQATIQNGLLALGSFVLTSPTANSYCGLHDVTYNNSFGGINYTKFFFGRSTTNTPYNVLFGFYFSGYVSSSTQLVQIADNVLTPGLCSNEYIGIITDLSHGIGAITNVFTPDERTGLQAAWCYQILRRVMTSDGYKMLKINFNDEQAFYASIFTNSPSSVANLMSRNSSTGDVATVNGQIDNILKGGSYWADASQLQVAYELKMTGTNGNALYISTLQNLQSVFSGIPFPPAPPGILRIININAGM